MEDKSTPFQLRLRIDWSDMDYFGHVNNVSYFRYIQASRVNYWEKSGLYDLYEKHRKGPLLASAKCDFHQSLLYPGEVIIRARMHAIGNSSFQLRHELYNEEGERAASGHDIMVMYDFQGGRKIPFPDDLRAEIERLEGRAYPKS